jgi:serine/threonine protein kinase
MWSVGILCYVLLTGFSPFGGDTDQETFRNIIHEPIDFPDELFEDVSPAAIDFIVRVAVKNAKYDLEHVSQNFRCFSTFLLNALLLLS